MEDYFELDRSARFRGLFCDTPRQEALYHGISQHTKSTKNIPIIKCGLQFIATSARGTDGVFSVFPLSRPGAIASNEPVIKGHSGPITDLCFSPFEDLVIASASTDKLINFWKLPKKGLTSDLTDPQFSLEGHQDAIKLIRFHPTTNGLLVSASSDQTVRLWDIQTKVALYEAAYENVTDLTWNVIGSEYLISSSTLPVSVCDARNKNGLITALPNTNGFSALMLGSTNMIFTHDVRTNVAKVWDYRNACREINTIDLKMTPSEDIKPLYDPDVKLLYLADKTCKNITVFDISRKDPFCKPIYTYKSKSIAKAMTMVPKRATNIAGCEVAKILKLVGDSIESLSFAVPRILDNFQEDLFPDTFAGIESQTKDEWWEQGIQNAPKLQSLNKEYAETVRANDTLGKSGGQSTPSPVKSKVESEDEEDEEGESDSDNADAIPMKLIQGTPFLKFGKHGIAHEKMLRLREGRYVSWDGAWFSPKLGKKCYVDLEKALRIQKGQMTTKFDRESKYYGAAKDTAFSIIYIEKREEKSLDFIAQSKEDFEVWFGVIDGILKKIRATRESTALTLRFLKFSFEMADTDKNEILSGPEVRSLMNDLSINSSAKDIQTVFRQITNSDRADHLNFDQFSKFVFALRRRFDLELIWTRLIEDNLNTDVSPLQVRKDGSIETEFLHEHSMLPLIKFARFWKSSTQTTLADADAEKKIAAEANNILRIFMGNDYNEADPQLTYDGFFRLMNSETNDAYDPYRKSLHQDMTHPLSYYFMYSSHNTYLETDQLVGKSSVNRYINDLLRGVRCVELDTWDGPEGDPIITHGGTLTTSISFLDVIKAIKTFGFAVSPYPVVLSIENHCSLQQQRRMAVMMRGIFGDMLLDANVGYYARSDILLESPEELQMKILVKGSRPRRAAVEEEEVEDEEEEEYDDDDDAASLNEGVLSGSITNLRSRDDSIDSADDGFSAADTTSVDETLETSSVRSGTTAGGSKKTKKKKPKPTLEREGSMVSTNSKMSSASKDSKDSKLSSSAFTSSTESFSLNTALGLNKEKTHEFLASITYLATRKIKHFDSESSRLIPADNISSFRESNMEKFGKRHLRDWINHNRTHLSRVYPNGVRIDSSNYDPIPAWYAGAQLVALNTQTHDLPNILNDGMFRQNGGSGYVLKPAYMLENGAKKDPPCRIRINIISGQSIPKMRGKTHFPSPLVEVSVNGMFDDTRKEQTTTVQKNGFDPIWDQVFDFTVKLPDIAQLTFQVMNEDMFMGVDRQKLLASGSIPLNSLRSGFRIVRLYDENGRNDFEFAFATLFVHISKEIITKDISDTKDI